MFSITVNVVVILVEVRCRYFNLLQRTLVNFAYQASILDKFIGILLLLVPVNDIKILVRLQRCYLPIFNIKNLIYVAKSSVVVFNRLLLFSAQISKSCGWKGQLIMKEIQGALYCACLSLILVYQYLNRYDFYIPCQKYIHR